ncbi:MAG: hypothetical protein Q8K93_00600, partial [Reyranella sp.]|nr:hypothetical protein [Reyranella sp.]
SQINFAPTSHYASLDIASGATLNNLSTGVIDLHTSMVSNSISGSGTINNAGSITKTLNGATAQTVSIDPTFNNQVGGSVDVQSGTLLFTKGNTDAVNAPDAGHYSVAAGATLQFAGGVRKITGNVTGAGNLVFSGGTGTDYDLAGTYDITGSTTASFNHYTNATLDFIGTVSSIGTSYTQSGVNTTVTFQSVPTLSNLASIGSVDGNTSFSTGTSFPALTTLSKTASGTLDFANANLNLTSYTQTGGTVTGTGTVTIPSGGTFTWGGGTLGGAGILSTVQGSTTHLNGGSTYLGAGRTWNNASQINFAPTSHYASLDIASGATLNNLSTGVIDLHTSMVSNSISGSGT